MESGRTYVDPKLFQAAIAVAGQHQSVNGTCAACNTPYPCEDPRATLARQTLERCAVAPLNLEPESRGRRAGALYLETAPSVQAREPGCQGEREGSPVGSTNRAGAPLNRRSFPRRRRVVGIQAGDQRRLQRLKSSKGSFAGRD